uniref:L-fucose mutarotase n=1 Tax=Paracidovorax avenae (strain ATCC 19860 / DSM 7227 / CCUG 15838 / JCM 20985 / LMG 2117 / NCPPB 1011) TaxID=643561 RepID=UPI001493DE6D|nr:Chain A, L-fucose mutarotase [Paracidovorax avenae ATCC 19860]7BYU_B Chain B, L-fucose mutarotase [Paracidovorax avenae ATCC 19860]
MRGSHHHHHHGSQRMGMVIGIKPEHIDEYKRLHAAVWPAVLARLAEAHVRNYSIFLREPENLLFGYWEYHGTDYAADMEAIAQDPETRRWWTFCGPCQEPLASRQPGEHWAHMEEVFHVD